MYNLHDCTVKEFCSTKQKAISVSHLFYFLQKFTKAKSYILRKSSQKKFPLLSPTIFILETQKISNVLKPLKVYKVQ